MPARRESSGSIVIDPDALAVAREVRAYGDRVSLVHSDYRNSRPRCSTRAGSRWWTRSPIWRVVDAARLARSRLQLSTTSSRSTCAWIDRAARRRPTCSPQSMNERWRIDDEFGEERHARRVARAIVEAGRTRHIETTGRLAEIVRKAVPRKGYSRIDPATRMFEAIPSGSIAARAPRRVPDARRRAARAGRLVVIRSTRWRTAS